MARLFGIDFFSVLSRGSQYRVESILLRISKVKNYILVSPSKQQVASMDPPECVPLVMEPESKMYSSPVIVLDFRSLYPSIMIAYNYWYSIHPHEKKKLVSTFIPKKTAIQLAWER